MKTDCFIGPKENPEIEGRILRAAILVYQKFYFVVKMPQNEVDSVFTGNVSEKWLVCTPLG
jgi:hypothetical protein